ncbi:hypothetical protein ACFQ6N_17265 [Kitasatospora sp. NPDC056446]|uniref:hypothetical protein n=1 Tax=Kitasatospora sp. NPDC056446 TaxID=3345819 RepID=UPI0036796E01
MTPITDREPHRRRRRTWPTPRTFVIRALLGAAAGVGALPPTLLGHWLTTR